MKKKDSAKKKPEAPRPNYVAKKHVASVVTFKRTLFPLLVTVLFTAVAYSFGWFSAIADKINSLLGKDTISELMVLIFTVALGGIVTISNWVIQHREIKRLKRFHVDFYDDIIELHDEDGIVRRTFYGYIKAETSLPAPSVIIPENAKAIKKLLCWKPLKFNYGNVTIECLEGPSDKIKLYCIENPKKLLKHLESHLAKTEPEAECTVEFGK